MSTATTTDWTIEVREDTGRPGDWETCPQGNFPSTIVGLFDVGMQKTLNDKKEIVEKRQLVLVVEASKKNSKGVNFCMSKLYTWSMHEKASFYLLVAALTGRKFQPGEKFDPRELIGMPCMMMVAHTAGTNKKGEAFTYANIASLSQFPEGFPNPIPQHQHAIWSVKMGVPLPDTSWVPRVYGKSLETVVKESAEYQAGKVNLGEAKSSQKPAESSDENFSPDNPPF